MVKFCVYPGLVGGYYYIKLKKMKFGQATVMCVVPQEMGYLHLSLCQGTYHLVYHLDDKVFNFSISTSSPAQDLDYRLILHPEQL